MSNFYSSSSTALTSTISSTPQYLRFNNQAEYHSWLAQYSRENEEGMRAQGISIIDFDVRSLACVFVETPLISSNYLQTYVPDKNLTTEFQCTSQLTGLLYPSPASPDLYMLQFIDRSGKRVDSTNLDVYDVGDLGDGTRQIIYPIGSIPGLRGKVDLYTLNPGSAVEICLKNNQVLRKVSFTYVRGSNIIPRIE